MKLTINFRRIIAALTFLFLNISVFSQINSTVIGQGAFGTYYGANKNYSVHIGYQAGWSGNAGNGHNVLVGYQSGYSNTSGMQNSFLGYRSGFSTTPGKVNTVIGKNARYQK